MPQYLYFVLCTSLHSWYASQLWYSRQAGVVRSSVILWCSYLSFLQDMHVGAQNRTLIQTIFFSPVYARLKSMYKNFILICFNVGLIIQLLGMYSEPCLFPMCECIFCVKTHYCEDSIHSLVGKRLTVLIELSQSQQHHSTTQTLTL